MAAKKTSKKTSAKKPAKKSTKKSAKAAKKAGGIGQAASTVFLINMIPKALSAETNQDSEPHLTVNPANPKQIVGTAFTPDPSLGPNAPIYVSLDGGNTWTLNSIVPSAAGSTTGTGDLTTSFNGNASKLYGAILRVGTSPTAMQFLRTNTFSTPPAMTVVKSRTNADQPFTLATTVGGKDRVYIGNNDFAGVGGKTATIDQSLDGGVGAPVFQAVRVEKRTTAGQDGPQTRPAVHSDGTVYAAFYRWRAMTGSFPSNTLVITSADVVVVRDDSGGSGVNPYTALIDAGDGIAGKRVVVGVSLPFMRNGNASTGQQRIGGSLSIAVSPVSSSTVYLVWGDKPAGSTGFLTLHVTRSLDRGKTWSPDLLTIPNATNGALAINSAGKIAFLYQQLRGVRWVTHVRRSTTGTTWDDLVLADTSATSPVKTFDPYLGDYCHMLSVRKDFYGIFSASNVPNSANFPNGVKYLRNANFATRRLLKLDNVTIVQPSIDPFFFKITE
jgi:hypothetical protein